MHSFGEEEKPDFLGPPCIKLLARAISRRNWGGLWDGAFIFCLLKKRFSQSWVDLKIKTGNDPTFSMF